MNYERGLVQLKQRLQGTEDYPEFNIYEARLRENLASERRYGSNEQIRATRAQIVEQLNNLANTHLQISFNELCVNAPSPSNLSEKPEYIQKEDTKKHRSSSPTTVFILHSHQDRKYLEELNAHLAHYVLRGEIHSWDKTKILPGSQWQDAIHKALQSSHVAVLLISADFLASEPIVKYELPYLMDTAKQKNLPILCVIVRPCAFQDTDLAKFWPINPSLQPLSRMSLPEREEIWMKVVEQIKSCHTT